MTEGQRFAIFFVVWVGLGVGTALLMKFGSPETKRS
jgi:hypothetical protein